MNYRLPEKIGTEEFFVWGPVTKVHKIEALGIAIVEYKDGEETKFHPYLNGKDCSVSTKILEESIIWAISCKSVGSSRTFNCNHAYFACKILELQGY